MSVGFCGLPGGFGAGLSVGFGAGLSVGSTFLAFILGSTKGPGISVLPLLLQLLVLQWTPTYRHAHAPFARGPLRFKPSRTVETTGRDPSFSFRAYTYLPLRQVTPSPRVESAQTRSVAYNVPGFVLVRYLSKTSLLKSPEAWVPACVHLVGTALATFPAVLPPTCG